MGDGTERHRERKKERKKEREKRERKRKRERERKRGKTGERTRIQQVRGRKYPFSGSVTSTMRFYPHSQYSAEQWQSMSTAGGEKKIFTPPEAPHPQAG